MIAPTTRETTIHTTTTKSAEGSHLSARSAMTPSQVLLVPTQSKTTDRVGSVIAETMMMTGIASAARAAAYPKNSSKAALSRMNAEKPLIRPSSSRVRSSTPS